MSEANNQIQIILAENCISDLKTFLELREKLYNINIKYQYLFDVIQTMGILLTSYGTAVRNGNLIWIGISLSSLATLISKIEKTNDKLMKELLNDIQLIKSGKYVDHITSLGSNSYRELNNV